MTARKISKEPLRSIGSEPDPRFSFANERTFLAWNRTALALILAGLVIIEALPKFNVGGGRKIVGLPLIILGGVISFNSFRDWEENERALRLKQPLPASRMMRVLAIGVTLGAVISLVIAAIGSLNV